MNIQFLRASLAYHVASVRDLDSRGDLAAVVRHMRDGARVAQTDADALSLYESALKDVRAMIETTWGESLWNQIWEETTPRESVFKELAKARADVEASLREIERRFGILPGLRFPVEDYTGYVWRIRGETLEVKPKGSRAFTSIGGIRSQPRLDEHGCVMYIVVVKGDQVWVALDYTKVKPFEDVPRKSNPLSP